MMVINDARSAFLEKIDGIPAVMVMATQTLLLHKLQRDIAERMRQKLPFAFRVEKIAGDTSKAVRCILTNRGQTVDLISLMPEGFRFEQGNDSSQNQGNQADVRRKRVTVANDIQKPGGLDSLLHEIGHTHQEEPPSVAHGLEVIPLFARWLGKKARAHFNPDLKGVSQLTQRGFFPASYLRPFHQKLGKAERDAWQFAVDKHVELAGRGFNAHPSKDDKRAFFDHIRFSLATYEIGHMFEMYVSGGKEAVEETQPAYLVAEDVWNKE